ncbi:cysteine synthase A [Candidatus Marinamargulisbacteria bacterium SCGC AG-343-D04]|nr:cysteine synthase A [Candidatus Marinamargulisbacteria bacterium SCGC AG-343-D04]
MTEKVATTYKTITDFIGNTPLIHLPVLSSESGATILGKCEFMNPCASVKDRTALALIEDAETKGLLDKDTTIIEATSGNTGIGLAFIAATKGYKVILTMPDSMTLERRKLLTALGAKIVLTPGHLGMVGAIEKMDELKKEHGKVFIPQQFNNEANPQIHFDTTAPEIERDTQGNVDIIVAGVGTGGTVAGIGRYFKTRKPEVQVFAVEPKDSAVLSGEEPGPHMIQGIGAGFIPQNISKDDFHGIVKVSNEDAMKMSQRLAVEEGVLCGISSGANVFASIELASRPENKGKTIVCVLCDFGERYLSTTLFSEEQ